MTNIMLSAVFCFVLATSLVSAASFANETASSCTVTSYELVANAVSSCTKIIIKGITVPAGKTLSLDLQKGTTLTFEETIKFEHSKWPGPLVLVKGSGVTVKGASGSVLDGQGALYWDGKGSSGTKKPKFFRIQTKDSSSFENIKLLNCPVQCVSIGAQDTTLTGWNVDVSAGDSAGGHNTDGFDISSSSNIVIENSEVKNQDDCVAINYASHITVNKLACTGGHGLSLSVGLSKTDSSKNTVNNVVFKNCVVKNSANGIHVKTHKDGATGYIKDVTYKNIVLSGITKYGINVQEDYQDGHSTKSPVGNVPITNLKLIDVKGTMSGSKSVPVYILCGYGGCSSWPWSGVEITGAQKASSCNFQPTGYTC